MGCFFVFYKIYKALATNPIASIPIKLEIKEIGINQVVFIFEKPNKLIPNSSGKGEAIIRTPITKANHLNNLNLKKALTLLPAPWCFNNSLKCSENLSLKNLNITKSPITAPKDPKMAVTKTESTLAISPKATIAGAVVKAEVKNIPAIKLPRNSSSLVEANKSIKIPVLTKRTAIIMLKKIITKS